MSATYAFLSILSLIVIPAAFALLAAFAYRRFHMGGLAVLWAVSSAVYGYLSFRRICSHPLTCDVGDDPYSAYYLGHVAPPFALTAAVAFAAVSLIIVRRLRVSPERRIRLTDLILATLGGMIGFIVAPPFLLQAFRW